MNYFYYSLSHNVINQRAET